MVCTFDHDKVVHVDCIYSCNFVAFVTERYMYFLFGTSLSSLYNLANHSEHIEKGFHVLHIAISFRMYCKLVRP